MNPDLHAAWLTAGNNLQPVGAWLGRNWIWLTAVVVAAGFAWWALRRELRAASEQVGAILADQRQPGSDAGLYLDCVAVYDDCDELDRLRDAIDQARKGEK